jgi:hypothetical protein
MADCVIASTIASRDKWRRATQGDQVSRLGFGTNEYPYVISRRGIVLFPRPKRN